MTMEDWVTTLMSWVGEPNIKDEFLHGKKIGDKTFKVHLDGYDQNDLLLNQGKSKRKEFYYFTGTTFHGMRYGDWKVLFREQEKWSRAPQATLSAPHVINLKLDPFERFINARGYDEWAKNRNWVVGPAGAQIAAFVNTFKEFPPGQESMSLEVVDFSKLINSQAVAR